MKILNIREGFACNSSSTHSIICTDRPVFDDDIQGGDFGWNYFTAASAEAKTLWMAISLRDNLVDKLGMDEATAKLVVTHITGTWPAVGLDGGYVDHQSLINFPRSWDGKSLDLEFAKDFMAYLLDPRIVIYGGNDNDEGSDGAPSGDRVYYRSILPVDLGPDTGGYPHQWVSRKDPSGYWTLFDRVSGNRVRVALDPAKLAVEAQRAAAPELVDLKITDFCTYDCPTCYQGSTKQGKHADEYAVYRVIDAMATAKVFEVAIGGGEPTLHPKFEEIIQHARERGVVPNFTTRDPKWFLRHPDSIPHIGGVAVSCDDRRAAEKVILAIEELPLREREILLKKTGIQHILGIAGEYEVSSLFRYCQDKGVRLVLLGYKNTHRGADGRPKLPKSGTWGDWLQKEITRKKDNIVPRALGVDTVLADEVKNFVPDYRITKLEGQFSCYVDAVPELPQMFSSSFGSYGPLQQDTREDNWFVDGWKKLTAYKPEAAYTYKKMLT